MATPIPMPYRVATHCQSEMGTALLHDAHVLTTCVCLSAHVCVGGGGGGGGASDCSHTAVAGACVSSLPMLDGWLCTLPAIK